MRDAAITIRRGDRLYGPYSATQIEELLKAGSVIQEDEVWSETAGKWTTLLEVLSLSPDYLNGKEHEIRLTAADVLGDPPPTDAAPERASGQRRDRVANFLAAVGLIAIALGTLDIALHMKRSAKSLASQAASPPRKPSDISNTTEAEETAKDAPQ